MLYLVSTPIGNLEDVTLRAIRMLKECDLVLCEDTRRTGMLLGHLGLKKPLESFNDINEKRKTQHVIGLLKEGKEICLVSDAGTPGVNDPGFYLVRECVRHGLHVVPVPGPTSIVAALTASGLATDRFCYLGFVPKQPGKRVKFLVSASKREETVILLETPHRIGKTIDALCALAPDREVVIARELTKKFEEFTRGKPSELAGRQYKGEIVLMLAGFGTSRISGP